MHSRKTANSTNRISDPVAIGILTLFLGQQHSSAALCFWSARFILPHSSYDLVGPRDYSLHNIDPCKRRFKLYAS